MDEILCSDNLWTTNEIVNSSIKLTVEGTFTIKDSLNSTCISFSMAD